MKQKKLGELCTITSSKRIFANQYVDEGIPFYRSKEIIEKSNGESISETLFISNELFETIKEKFGVPKKGDFLISAVGVNLGIPYVVDDETFYFKDGNLIWLKDFLDELDSSYLYYWFKTKYGKETIRIKSIGSAQPALTIDMMKKFKINIPTIEIQKDIVKILKNYDDLIKCNSSRIKVLENMAESIYKEWFVRFRFPNYKKVGFEDGLPTGWKIQELKDFGINLESGSRPKGGIDESLKNGIPSFGAEVIGDLGTFDYSEVKFVPFDFYKKMKRGKNENFNVLIYKDGAYIGKTTMFMDGYPFEKYCINEHVFFVEPDDFSYKIYLYFTLHQNEMFELMQLLNRNAAQPGLSQPDISRIKIKIPPKDIVVKFNDYVAQILELIFKYAKENHNLEIQRDLLLQRLMSDKLSVEGKEVI